LEQKTIRKILPLVVLALVILGGCAPRKTQKITCSNLTLSAKLLDVAPVYQTAFSCGPAAVTMVLNYYGADLTLEEATAKLITPSLKGTLITDMKKFAKPYMPDTNIRKSNICDVISSVSRGNPVILFLELGESIISSPHYIVAVGYDMKEQYLIFHNGYSEFRRASFRDINEKWGKMEYIALFFENN
jgi:predicted double-glycine peptidase